MLGEKEAKLKEKQKRSARKNRRKKRAKAKRRERKKRISTEIIDVFNFFSLSKPFHNP